MNKCESRDGFTKKTKLEAYIWLGIIYGLLSALFFLFIRKKKQSGHLNSTAITAYIPVEPVVENLEEPKSDKRSDDLTKILGIGPVISGFLKSNGIFTFKQLAGLDLSELTELLTANQYRLQNPETWPQQASLAEQGKWGELSLFQKELKRK